MEAAEYKSTRQHFTALLPFALTRKEIKNREAEERQKREVQRRAANEPNVTGDQEANVAMEGEKRSGVGEKRPKHDKGSGGEQEDKQGETTLQTNRDEAENLEGTDVVTPIADTPVPL